jgi:ribose 5-phosphate isomerase A
MKWDDYTPFLPVARRAIEMVEPGQTIGLGSGRASMAFLLALGERVRQGLRIQGVPTSEAIATQARKEGIPLLELAGSRCLDQTFDGADEVDPELNLIKGLGGALLREKVVASAARRLVILVGQEKLVPRLGSHGTLPVEVVPFALSFCQERLRDLGLAPNTRMAGADRYVTDNGNFILDCKTGPLDDPGSLDRSLHEVPGVAGTGLFLAMADVVLIQTGSGVTERERPHSSTASPE